MTMTSKAKHPWQSWRTWPAVCCALAVVLCLALPFGVFAVWDAVLYRATHPYATQAQPLSEAGQAQPLVRALYVQARSYGQMESWSGEGETATLPHYPAAVQRELRALHRCGVLPEQGLLGGAGGAGADEASTDKASTDKAGADEAGTDKASTDKAGADEAGIVVDKQGALKRYADAAHGALSVRQETETETLVQAAWSEPFDETRTAQGLLGGYCEYLELGQADDWQEFRLQTHSFVTTAAQYSPSLQLYLLASVSVSQQEDETRVAACSVSAYSMTQQQVDAMRA